MPASSPHGLRPYDRAIATGRGLLRIAADQSGSETWPKPTKSSSPAPSPARSTRRRCRRICRSRRRRSPTPRIGAAEAGAAIVHLHARNPQDGRPDQTPEAFAPFLKVIKQASNVVINITTGGAPTMAIEERVRPAATLKPEVASLNMGTMNFGLYPMIPRYKGKFKHDWEEPYLEGSRKGMFKNTFADIEYILHHLLRERHPLRGRVLRHRPSLHAEAFSRSRRDQGAAVRAVGVRHSRRHRRASRKT